MDEVAVLQRRLISQAAAASSVLAGLALLSGRRPEAWGVLLGTVVAIFNFSLLARSIRNLIGADPRSARLKGGLGYIGRYLLTAAALFYSYTSPHLNIYAVLVGLLMLKVLILGKAVMAFCKERVTEYFHSAHGERGDK